MDRPDRTVRVGDELLFAIGGRVTALRIAGLGVQRGPPEEARALYSSLEAWSYSPIVCGVRPSSG